MGDKIKEAKIIYPQKEFFEKANFKDPSIYSRAFSEEGWELFWEDAAKELAWIVPWERFIDESNKPFYRFFVGGKINACYNCIDRHLEKRRNKAAIIWEGENYETRVLTYQDLYREVSKFANVLKSLGIKKGDRVVIYLPMIPEIVIAMLACARIGAIHSVVFSGFSSKALADRIIDAEPKLLITCDGYYRRGKLIELKKQADEALKIAEKESRGKVKLSNVIVVRRAFNEIEIKEKEKLYDELMKKAKLKCEIEKTDSEDTLFIIYTSGTTGKPKGVEHSVGGYLVYVNTTSKILFDLKENDIFWCTADIGWITGHSYVVYGPLSNGASIVIYEGSLDFPDKDRTWEIIEKYNVTIFYTAPTAIRLFMKWGEEHIKKHDISSIRLLGSVGEPINPEVWLWYYKNVGREKAPIVDTWWQTETGGAIIAPIPSLTPMKPGSATKPLPGIFVDIFDEHGNSVGYDKDGYLVITRPWPGMLKTIFKDDARYIKTYWSKFNGRAFFTGDAAIRDRDNYIWILGRVDDIIKVAGHRLSTAEIESRVVELSEIAESAVVGRKHELKGEEIIVYATPKHGVKPSKELAEKVKKHIRATIGAIATPGLIIFADDLPKTRSGKIMRRVLRAIANKEKELGDLSTIANPEIIERIKEALEKASNSFAVA